MDSEVGVLSEMYAVDGKHVVRDIGRLNRADGIIELDEGVRSFLERRSDFMGVEMTTMVDTQLPFYGIKGTKRRDTL